MPLETGPHRNHATRPSECAGPLANRSLYRHPLRRAGARGGPFTYGGAGHPSLKRRIDGPYAVIDFQTTGLNPRGGDRVVDVAIVRVSADGTVGEPWSTLLNPDRDTGVSFIHHITDADVAPAPRFRDVAPYLLSQLDGAVVVAHNAPFDEGFLAMELDRAGYGGLRMPAVCTLWMAQTHIESTNHRLPTLAKQLQIPLTNYDSRDHVLATAEVLKYCLQRFGSPLLHGPEPYRWTGGPVTAPRTVARVQGIRKGQDGYMTSLMSRLSVVSGDIGDAAQDAYLDMLATAMADNQISREEAQQLAKVAGNAGMDRETVRGLNERFLETLREAAYADHVLTAAELRDLKRAAKMLGVPTYFDDLAPTTSASGTGTRGAAQGAGPRKCGHCGEAGHYRPRCPELGTASSA